MSLLKRLLLTGGMGGGAPATPIFPTEYIWTEGTGDPYDIYYDDEDGSGRYLVKADASDSINPTATSGQRKIARLSSGKLYIIFHTKNVANYIISVIESDDDGVTWGNQTQVGTGWTDGAQSSGLPCLVVGSDDNLYATWIAMVGSYKQKLFSIFNGTSWSGEARCMTGVAGMTTGHQDNGALTLDGLDNLHVVARCRTTAHPSYQQVYYTKYTGTWNLPVRISTYLGMENYYQLGMSIAVDSNGDVHVVWHGLATGYTTGAQIWYAKYDGSWSAPIIIATYETSSTPQASPCIAIDSSDNLHVVWYGQTLSYPTAYQIWYTKYDGSWLSPPTRLSTYTNMSNTPQYYPNIGIDLDDNLHVVWEGMATGYAVLTVWYTKYTGSWSAPTPVQSAGTNRRPVLRWSLFP